MDKKTKEKLTGYANDLRSQVQVHNLGYINYSKKGEEGKVQSAVELSLTVAFKGKLETLLGIFPELRIEGDDRPLEIYA